MLTQKVVNILVSLMVLTTTLFGSSNQLLAAAQVDTLAVDAPVSAPISQTDETKVPHYFGPWSNYANSPFTITNATVAIIGDGTGAAATASVDANGVITGITVTSPGSGYFQGTTTVSITGSGTGATADPVVSTTGVVTGITVTAPGTGFTTPTVSITGGGALTDATASAYGGIDTLTLTSAGTGYSMPTVDFDMPDDPNGVQAKAHVVCVEVNCAPTTTGGTVTITGIVIDNPGSGYMKAPNVVIRDGTIFAPLNDRIIDRATEARNQMMQDGKLSSAATTALIDAAAVATINIQEVKLDTFGSGYTSAPMVAITDLTGTGSGATANAITDVGAVTAITVTAGGTGYITQGGIKKFQDGLPVLCDPTLGWANCTDNNLGQHIPIAVPDQTTFTVANGYAADADYFVIALVQHREQMNSSLPATLLREYVQLETPANAAWSKHIALQTDLIDGTSVPTLMPDGTQAYAVDDPHYLGPLIIAQKDRAVRLTFYNLLPSGMEGDLFLPVDTTFMGSGMGPMTMAMNPMDMGTVMDEVRNPACGEVNKNRMDCFAETRATLHLHGGISPWISDGSPHQWITPANEMTSWPEGVAVSEVPDMIGQAAINAGVPDCSAEIDGCMTFYYTNQQSARLMFYHDHSWGITRLNVYAGEAAGYLIRDNTEQSLINLGLIPSGTDEIPLIIQDRTYVPSDAQLYGDLANGVYGQDPTWDKSRWGGEGNLWYEHVYMPAQNPGDPGGMSAYGRWMYGPWFWPPSDSQYPPINNPYYNMDPLGPDGVRGTADDFTTPLAVPCDLNNPATWQYTVDPFCEPALIPGTPNNSAGMEQFNDTPVVNGTAYPTVTLEPKSYRFRILNAANDRFWNLQWYIADPTTASTSLNQMGEVIGGTEVALKAAEVAAAQLDPVVFPTPDTTISLPGPDWVQIGNESGFLPAPVLVDGQQVTTWITDPTRFDVGNVDLHSLLIAPAERADVIVDFSKFAGQTLIMYNDAPAAFPARVPSYDYYTGYPDQSPNGPSAILPGYGPNTRTIMQVKIAANRTDGLPISAYNLVALQNAFKHHANGSGVFESGQNPIVVGQAAYNTAYGTNFTTAGWCNNPTNPSAQCDGFARINEQGGDTFKFDTLVGNQVGVTIQPKAIHDETNATNFEPYGRMSGNLGVEAVPATPGLQNVVLYPFVNPATELINATNLPTADLKITAIASGSDGTQIWKITHNGVDTHPIHFHLYDVQLLNRVTWDNIIIQPDANELGWKETVRVSPLEDTIFAIRPIIPVVPFELPNSIRPLNPMMPLGDTTMFNNTDAFGNPTTPIANALVNYGLEYMMHCHILSHEEMDMMRPVAVVVPPNKPDGLTYLIIRAGNKASLTLTWNDNSINETAFLIQNSADGITWTDVGSVPSPLDQPNVHGTRSYTDTTFQLGTTSNLYRVVAQNTIGYGGQYMGMTAQSVSDSIVAIPNPTNLITTLQAGPQVRLTWTDNAINETGFVIERSVDGVTFTQLATVGPRNNTGSVTYTDTTVTLGATYTYRVAATATTGMSSYSNKATILVDIPVAPSNLAAFPVAQGGNQRVTVSWTDNSNNETGFTIQWSTNPGFTTIAGTANVGANATTYVTGNIARVTWYFRIRANNVLGSSAWVTTAGILPAAPTKAPTSPLEFWQSFEVGLADWTGQTGLVQASPLASMGGYGFTGLSASWGVDEVEGAVKPAYVFHQTAAPMGSYMANFSFNPNGAFTSATPIDIFTGIDAAGYEIFGIQYLHTADAPDLYQIRGWVRTGLIDVPTEWVTISNAEQNLQLDWQSTETSSLNLYVNGELLSAAAGDSVLFQLVEVRLGPSRGVENTAPLAAGNSSSTLGTIYLDEFVSLSTEVTTPFVPVSPFYIFLPTINN